MIRCGMELKFKVPCSLTVLILYTYNLNLPLRTQNLKTQNSELKNSELRTQNLKLRT